MRILFATTAGAGHYAPMVPFARACRAAGHGVRVAAPPSFASVVQASGLELAAVGERRDEDAQAMFARLGAAGLEEANSIMLRDGFGRLYPEAALPAMRELVASWRPGVVVRESFEFAALLAAREHDVPTVEVTNVLLTFRATIVDSVEPALAALAAEHGLPQPSAPDLLDRPVLALTPPTLDPPADGAHRYRVTSRREPAPAPDQPLLVYVTFGTEAGRGGRLFPGLYRAAIDALTGHGWQVLVATGRDADLAALGPIPADVRVEPWVDQGDVLRRSAAAVFHGGYGTLIDVIAVGVPTVVVPLFSADQRVNADRVAELGAGIALAGPGDMSALPVAVDRVVTDSSYASAAANLGDEVASLEPDSAAVGLLESLAS